MKSQFSTVKAAAAAVLLILVTGCLVEDKGSKEETVGTPTSTPPDFTSTPNPAPPAPAPTPAPAPAPTGPITGPSAGIIANNGVLRTKLDTVPVKIFPEYLTAEMKVGFTADCSDGAWEPYQLNKTVTLPVLNADNIISVEFMDSEMQEGSCYTAHVIHDNLGPSIIFSRYPPASLEEGSSAELVYEVQDDAGVSRVFCSLNELEKNCAAGSNTVSITALPEGNYVFTVEARDRLGNVSTESVNFAAVSTTRRLTQSISIDAYRKVDILMVIDNSGSMQYEQQNMAQRTSNFLSVIHGLDWQIGVTTTDPRDIPLGDGRLIPIYGSNGQFILDTTTQESDAQFKLGMTLQRPETGSGTEEGIFAAYRAIERSLSNANPAHQQLFRRFPAQWDPKLGIHVT